MELNKLEKQIKEQLNSREIQPSEMAWDKLDSLLNAAEKPKRKFSWMYIAASFVGFLLIGTVFFTVFDAEIIDKNQPAVVLEQKADVSNSKEPNVEEVVSNIVQNKIVYSSKVVANAINTRSKQLSNNENTVPNINQSKENNGVLNTVEILNSPVVNKSRYISAEKLLAEVNNSKSESSVYYKTIDRTKNGIAVNANSLLSNAETELNQSFRETALEKLNKNYNAIKTVLVNRNYQE
jgi:hypothetical protein